MSDGRLAGAMGVDRTLLWRVKTGRCKPGEGFIARLLAVFPEVKFEDIFFLEVAPLSVAGPVRPEGEGAGAGGPPRGESFHDSFHEDYLKAEEARDGDAG